MRQLLLKRYSALQLLRLAKDTTARGSCYVIRVPLQLKRIRQRAADASRFATVASSLRDTRSGSGIREAEAAC